MRLKNPDDKIQAALREVNRNPKNAEAVAHYCNLILRANQKLDITLLKVTNQEIQETILNFPASSINIHGFPLLNIVFCIWEPLIEHNLHLAYAAFTGEIESLKSYIEEIYYNTSGAIIVKGVIRIAHETHEEFLKFIALFDYESADFLPARWILKKVIINDEDAYFNGVFVTSVNDFTFHETEKFALTPTRESSNKKIIQLHSPYNEKYVTETELETYDKVFHPCNNYPRIPSESAVLIEDVSGTEVNTFLPVSINKENITVSYRADNLRNFAMWKEILSSKPGESEATDEYILNLFGAVVLERNDANEDVKYRIIGVIGGLADPNNRESRRNAMVEVVAGPNDDRSSWLMDQVKWPPTTPMHILGLDFDGNQITPERRNLANRLMYLEAGIDVMQNDYGYITLPAFIRIGSNIWFLPTRRNPEDIIEPINFGVTKEGIHWAVWHKEPDLGIEIRIKRISFLEVTPWEVSIVKFLPTKSQEIKTFEKQIWPPKKNWWAQKRIQDIVKG